MTDATTADDPLVYVRTVVGHASYRATNQGRVDLVEQLERHRAALDQLEGATVVVVGLCDAGKSSLINACVGRRVVPVDLVHPTPVPVMVAAGDGAVRFHHREDGDGGHPVVAGLADVDSEFSRPQSQLNNLHLVEIGCPQWPRPASLVLVDTPSQSIGTTGARALLTGFDPDVLVMATDAGQELSQIELATIAYAHHRSTQVVVALTKVDLHAHWRRIRDVNEGHLRQAGISVPILPVSARLHEIGQNNHDAGLMSESGIAPLLEILDHAATGVREVYLCSRALAAVLEVTDDLAAELQSQRDLLNDPEAARRANEQLIRARERIERLNGAGAKWRERLYDGLERLQMETDHDLRARMTRLQSEALEEIDAIDPAENWPIFSTRLERTVDAEVNSVFEALADNSKEVADDVARLFGDESGRDTTEIAFSDHEHVLGDMRIQGRLETVEPGQGASAINAIRGSAASMSITALVTRYGAMLVGGTLVSVVLLPVGAAMTILLGHHALKSSRESRTVMRRRAATLAVRKYLDGIGPEVAVQMRSDLMTVRVELRDHFERVATAMAAKVDAEMRMAMDSLRASSDERERRLSSVDEELKQVELVAAHARRARDQLAAGSLAR